jgi:hypothetical protein
MIYLVVPSLHLSNDSARALSSRRAVAAQPGEPAAGAGESHRQSRPTPTFNHGARRALERSRVPPSLPELPCTARPLGKLPPAEGHAAAKCRPCGATASYLQAGYSSALRKLQLCRQAAQEGRKEGTAEQERVCAAGSRARSPVPPRGPVGLWRARRRVPARPPAVLGAAARRGAARRQGQAGPGCSRSESWRARGRRWRWRCVPGLSSRLSRSLGKSLRSCPRSCLRRSLRRSLIRSRGASQVKQPPPIGRDGQRALCAERRSTDSSKASDRARRAGGRAQRRQMACRQGARRQRRRLCERELDDVRSRRVDDCGERGRVLRARCDW